MDQITSTIVDNAIYIGGGVLALILGLFGLSRFRRKKSEQIEDSLIGPATTEGGASSVFGSTGGRSVDTGSALQTDFSQSGIGAIDTDAQPRDWRFQKPISASRAAMFCSSGAVRKWSASAWAAPRPR